MSTATPDAPPVFIGWFRPRKGLPWTRIAEGPDYDTTLGRLVEALSSMRGGDSVVLRAADDPNAPPRFQAGGRRLLWPRRPRWPCASDSP